MDLEKNARIETHENVTIAYETANIGSRFLALLLDEIIIMGIIILSVLIAFFAVLGGGGEQMDPETGLPAGASLFTTLAVMMIVIFLVQNVYYIFFEMVMKGRSPGKKAAGIRVVSATGEPISFSMSLIRNFLRLLHMIPGGELADALVVIYNKRSMRIGDLLANTMVIKEREEKRFSEKLSVMLAEMDRPAPHAPSAAGTAEAEALFSPLLTPQRRETSAVQTQNSRTLDAGDASGLGGACASAAFSAEYPVNVYGQQAYLRREEYAYLRAYLLNRPEIGERDVLDYKFFCFCCRRAGAAAYPGTPAGYMLNYLRQTEFYHRQFYAEAR